MKKCCLSLIAVLLLASVILSGCNNSNKKSETQSEPELSKNFNAVDLNNLQGDKTINDNSQESSEESSDSEEEFDLKKEACNLSDINGSSLKEISVPKKIGNYSVQKKIYVDKTRAYVILGADTINTFSQNEFGIYNFETKKYELIFKIKKGTMIYILESNADYISYTLEYDNGAMCGDGGNVYNSELWICNVKTKKARKVYKYRTEGYFLVSCKSNKPLIFEGNLYFNDISEDTKSADLWSVKLDSGTAKLLKKDVITPVLYNNKLFMFKYRKLGNSVGDILTNLDDTEQVKFEKVVDDILISKKEMFISVGYSTVIDFTNNRIIYSSNSSSVNTLMGNDNYLAMSTLSGYNTDPTGDGFYIYSIKNKKFINICNATGIKLNSPLYRIDFAKDDTIFLATVDELNDEEKTYIVDIKE